MGSGNKLLDESPAISQQRFKIPKDKHAVTITLIDGQRLEGQVFLSQLSSVSPGRQTVLELMNEQEPFLPFEHDESYSLINKSHVSVIKVATREDAGFSEEEPTFDVRVHIVGADPPFIEGRMAITMPEGRQRLIDLFNDAKRVTGMLCADGPVLVACDHIVRVRLMDDARCR